MNTTTVSTLKYKRNSTSGFFAIGLSVFLSLLIIAGYFSLQLYVIQAEKALLRMATSRKADAEAKNALNVASVLIANNLVSYDQGVFKAVGGGTGFGWSFAVCTPPSPCE